MKLSDEDKHVLETYHRRKSQAGGGSSQQSGGIDWISVALILIVFVIVAVLNIRGVI